MGASAAGGQQNRSFSRLVPALVKKYGADSFTVEPQDKGNVPLILHVE
jgi:hypothetical protein